MDKDLENAMDKMEEDFKEVTKYVRGICRRIDYLLKWE